MIALLPHLTAVTRLSIPSPDSERLRKLSAGFLPRAFAPGTYRSAAPVHRIAKEQPPP